jgi:hypothetical protein
MEDNIKAELDEYCDLIKLFLNGRELTEEQIEYSLKTGDFSLWL